MSKPRASGPGTRDGVASIATRACAVAIFGFVLLALVPARSAPAAPQEPAPVEGRVLVRGRVIDGAGQPVSGAEVCCGAPCGVQPYEWNLIPFEARRPERRQDFARATSAADGAFALEMPREPALHLAVRRAGFAGLDRMLVVEPAARALELGELLLDAGRVLMGAVHDAEGAPIPGAEIARRGLTEFTRRERLDWQDVVLATSGPDGAFRVDTLGAGETELEVRAPGFVRERRLVSPAGAEEWSVTLERAALVTGRVKGAPAGAELGVRVEPESGEAMTVPCALDGSFAIDGLAPDLPPVALAAVRRGDAPGFDLDGLPGWRTLTSTVLVEPGTSGVELRVSAGVVYRLAVTDATTTKPLSGVRLGLFEGFDVESRLPSPARGGPEGRYEVELQLAWASSARALAVSCARYERVALGELPYTPGEVADLGVVELAPLPPLRVHVACADDGSPLADATVSASVEVYDDGCANAHMVGDWPARSTQPDGWSGTSAADGTAMAYLDPKANYWLRVDHIDHAGEWVHVSAAGRPPEVRVSLSPGGTLAVRCLDAGTLAPLAGEALLYDALDTYERFEAWTDADGRVRLEHLEPGSYEVWSVRDRRYPGRAVVEEGRVAEIVLVVGAKR